MSTVRKQKEMNAAGELILSLLIQFQLPAYGMVPPTSMAEAYGMALPTPVVGLSFSLDPSEKAHAIKVCFLGDLYSHQVDNQDQPLQHFSPGPSILTHTHYSIPL